MSFRERQGCKVKAYSARARPKIPAAPAMLTAKLPVTTAAPPVEVVEVGAAEVELERAFPVVAEV